MTMGLISVNRLCLGKMTKQNKSNMIEGLNNLKTVGENKKGFIERQYKR